MALYSKELSNELDNYLNWVKTIPSIAVIDPTNYTDPFPELVVKYVQITYHKMPIACIRRGFPECMMPGDLFYHKKGNQIFASDIMIVNMKQKDSFNKFKTHLTKLMELYTIAEHEQKKHLVRMKIKELRKDFK